ncbi:hypothetical protein [Flavobacterium sp. C4GT6]|uniref:hypothetical protein n=1 Tax=Flavobacterium sp. C4GT6 TaxID=3103818 RepID=UPI002ECFF2A4
MDLKLYRRKQKFFKEIKTALIKKIENQDDAQISSFLTQRFNRSYSALSKLSSKTLRMTDAKNEISLKI